MSYFDDLDYIPSDYINDRRYGDAGGLIDTTTGRPIGETNFETYQGGWIRAEPGYANREEEPWELARRYEASQLAEGDSAPRREDKVDDATALLLLL